MLLDFEGEPARPLAERRRKQSPLKDVAGMLRSFSYAARAALDRYLESEAAQTARRLDQLPALARAWEHAASTAFLRSWQSTVASQPGFVPPPEESEPLLSAYMLEKALYELLYELNNRPAWVSIPLAGILSL